MPGKFEGNPDEALAERLYDVTMESGQDEDVGSVDELGWYGLILDFEGKSYIVEQDTYGFFGYTEYESADAARAGWKQVEDTYNAYYEENPEELQEGAVVEDVGPGVPAIVGEAGPEAVIPLDDPAAVATMAAAIEEGGAAHGANANDATIAAAEAVESAAEAVEVVAVADAAEGAVEAQAEAVEGVAEVQAEVAEEAVEAVEEVAEEEIDERPEPVHGFFR